MNPKRLFLLAVGLLAAVFSAHAQTSVWKISKGEHSLYLGGTSHLLRPSDFPLPPEFDTAYAAASAVYFETDLRRAMSPEMQQIVMQRGMFTDESTLQSALSPEAWQAVQEYCATNGLPIEQLMKFRPWLFVTMISVQEVQKLGVTQEGVDLHYLQRAMADGKKLGQLEAFERQVEFLTSMGAGQESAMIVQVLTDLGELPEQFAAMLKAWRSGDMDTLDKLVNDEMRAKYPGLYESLLVERNRNWIPEIERLVASPEVEFVLAGVGHMAGPDGLLALLEQRDYTVEQVNASNAR